MIVSYFREKYLAENSELRLKEHDFLYVSSIYFEKSYELSLLIP